MDEKFKQGLDKYMADLDAHYKHYTATNFPGLHERYNGQYDTFRYITGPKYVKVLIKSGGQESVHCFIEKATGNLLKAAGYNAPAKGARGNIFNEKRPLHGREFYVR